MNPREGCPAGGPPGHALAVFGRPAPACAGAFFNALLEVIDLNFEDCVHDAIETVLAWELPDEVCPEALTAQAALLAGMEPDAIPGQ